MRYKVSFASFSFIQYGGRFMVLVAAYCCVAQIGSVAHMVSGFPTLLWPSTSIGVVAMFFWGYEVWPAILLGAFLAGLLVDISVPVAVGIAIGNALEVFAVVYFLRNIVMLDPVLGRMRDSIGLLATCVSVTVIGTSVGVTSMVLGGGVSAGTLPQTWFAWWLGDSVTALVLVPFLIRWLWRPFFSRTPQELVEGVTVLEILAVADSIAFLSPIAKVRVLPLAYIFAPLLWIAMRLGPRGLTLANLLTAAFALSSTYLGLGLFTQGTSDENIFLTQGFIGIIVVVFSIVASSVEEYKETERSLEGHIGRLEDVVERVSLEDKAKTDFIAILAHELRNPLAPIVSAVEMVRIHGVRSENAELFNTIEAQVYTMGRLLDDLLDISRISHKKLILKEELVELQSVLAHSLVTVGPFIAKRGHTITTTYPEHPVWLFGDPIRLAQIFVNLLHNAAKYTNPGGTITIRCSQGQGVVQVQVADTGMGVEPHMLQKIFEPFVQGRSASSEVGTGLGVGLALTKQLVELHGGSITVASEGKNKGSIFAVTLPVSTQPLHEKTTTNAPEIPTHKRTVLIVDDNEAAAQVMRTLLEHIGHTVTVAHSGAEAIEYAHARTVDAVILDIGLPDMNGFEVAKQLRAVHGSAPTLIALSGYGQKEDRDKARVAGFDHYLTKPARVADVDRLLQQRKASA